MAIKTSKLFAFLAISWATTVAAQDDVAQRQVLAASEARMSAVLRADADTLNLIQDDDFVLIQDGLVLNKAEQIARVLAFDAPEGLPRLSIELNNISFTEDVAIITGIITIGRNNNGFRSAFTEVWLRKGELWLAKAAHYSTIPRDE
jgi:hypothetical protein